MQRFMMINQFKGTENTLTVKYFSSVLASQTEMFEHSMKATLKFYITGLWIKC